MRILMGGLVLGAALAMSGCGSATTPQGESPDGPVVGGRDDSDLLADTTGDAPFYIDSVTVRVAESYPVQLFLEVTGSAPTPCHLIAYTVDDRDGEMGVAITTDSPETPCAQVLQPHEFVIPLGPTDLPITLRVNDGEYVETVRP